MSHSCVCDKGYSGPSCADRSCPVGDDPLTTDQQYETQWIEIKSAHSSNNDHSFSGSIKLSFTDHNGETYVTDDITVAPYEGSATSTTAAFAAALNGLPNHVLSGVTVSEGYCQTAIPGTFTTATNTITNAVGAYDSSNIVSRCDFADGTDAVTKFFAASMGGALNDRDGAGQTFNDETGVVCYTLSEFYCNRYKVTFAGTPGNTNALVVNTADIVVAGATAAGGSAGTISSSVTDTLQVALNDANGIQVSFTALGQAASSTASCATCTITASTKTIALANAGGGDGAKYDVDERIVVTCNSVAWGTYTVASVATDDVVVVETIKDCAGSVAVSLDSYVIATNTKLDGILSVGDRLSIDSFASIPPTIEAFKWVGSTGVGRIILSGAYSGDDANNDETATTKGTHKVYQYGVGTTESSSCSDRGVCNGETGACKCFKGYTGKACSTQNALAS